MSTIVKSEPLDANTVELKIVDLLKPLNTEDGLTTEEIVASFQSVNMPEKIIKEMVVAAINNLRKKDLITFWKKNDVLTCKYNFNASQNSNLKKGLDSAEKLIYEIIEEADRKGISDKDIKEKSNINSPLLEKYLKSLEGKKLIKQIKTKIRRKMYMLSHLVPDESVTGGVFYSDQNIDSQYVELVNKCCLRILQERVESTKGKDLDIMELRNSQFLSTNDILKILNDSRVSKVRLNLADIESIMDTLLFDGKVEKNVILERDRSSQTNLYRATSPFIRSSGLMYTPCGHCPVRSDCRPGNVISPERCVYMSTWLDF